MSSGQDLPALVDDGNHMNFMLSLEDLLLPNFDVFTTAFDTADISTAVFVFVVVA
jgi:hypothetical protein